MRTLRKRVIIHSVFCALLGLPATTSAIAGSVGSASASPSSVPAGVATIITITSAIADAALIPGSVQLQSLDGNGNVVALVGLLHDDGLNGDAAAGDGIFTIQTPVLKNASGTVTFRVTAGFRGSLTRGFSAPVTVKVTDSKSAVILSPGATHIICENQTRS